MARGRKGLLVRLLGLWFFVPALVIVAGALPIADDLRAFLVPLILLYLVWPVIGLVSLICAIRLARMRLRLQSVLAFLVSVSVILCIVGPWKFALLDPLFRANALLHFKTMKTAYDRQLRALPQSERHLHVFIWQSDPVGGSGVAYDDSDQISLTRKHRAKQWLGVATEGVLSELCSVERLDLHYYLVSFGCSFEPR